MTKGNPNREVILGNFPRCVWGGQHGIRVATLRIADSFHVKKSVNLRKDHTKNHDTPTVLLLGVPREVYKQPGAVFSALFGNRKIPDPLPESQARCHNSWLWRKQMGKGEAPSLKSVSLRFLSCIGKAFFKNTKIGTNQTRHLGFTEEGSEASWVWLENTQGTLSWR